MCRAAHLSLLTYLGLPDFAFRGAPIPGDPGSLFVENVELLWDPKDTKDPKDPKDPTGPTDPTDPTGYISRSSTAGCRNPDRAQAAVVVLARARVRCARVGTQGHQKRRKIIIIFNLLFVERLSEN